jgi:hypothetical protein
MSAPGESSVRLSIKAARRLNRIEEPPHDTGLRQPQRQLAVGTEVALDERLER